MKKFLHAVIENTQPYSQKWLLTSFISGYFLATLFFGIFSSQVHHFLNSLFQGF
jgi:hypothetical protein